MKKPPRNIPTPQNLHNVALHYLGRYAASAASLRRVLQNRIRRAAYDDPAFAADHNKQAELHSAIETIIASHVRTGVLNDAVFAETKVNSLRRQGQSQRMIKQKLATKGITGDSVAAALAQHADGIDSDQAELQAALTWLRKKQRGAFRPPPKSDASDAQEDKRKDFAALARAGFSAAIARQAIQRAEGRDQESDSK